MHWKELPLAIPQDDNEMIFSGSAVSDKDNTSGFGTAGTRRWSPIYTSAQKATGKQAAGPRLQHRRRPDLDQIRR